MRACIKTRNFWRRIVSRFTFTLCFCRWNCFPLFHRFWGSFFLSFFFFFSCSFWRCSGSERTIVTVVSSLTLFTKLAFKRPNVIPFPFGLCVCVVSFFSPESCVSVHFSSFVFGFEVAWIKTRTRSFYITFIPFVLLFLFTFTGRFLLSPSFFNKNVQKRKRNFGPSFQ